MIDILELRTGNIEVFDTHIHEERRQLFRTKLILQYGLLFIVILTLVLIWRWYVIIFLVAYGAIFYRVRERLIQQLPGKIASVLITMDIESKVENLVVRRWMPGQIHLFNELPVRFNQAIGYKVISDEEGLMTIELIVDQDYPGTPIFETFDLYALAEFHRLFSLIFPDYKTWLYKYHDGTNWTDDELTEIENEVRAARVHWKIRDYFAIEVHK